MCLSLQPSRLARYSLAATAAAAGFGGVAVGDVTLGSFNVSFGRAAGTNFFNGFSSTTYSTYGGVALGMGDLSAGLLAVQAPSFADAYFRMSIYDVNSDRANFNQSSILITNAIYGTSVYGGAMVDAGAVWQSGTNTSLRVQAFYTHTNTGGSYATWTNPDATGTKFVNFFLDGDDGDIYGWIQLDFNITDANDWSVTIGNWAYSDDGPLAAGSTGAPAVPGLGGLAALAIGAAGVRGRRQRMAG